MTEIQTATKSLEENYQKLKTALIDRITRRYQALTRLSPDTLDAGIIESRLQAAGNDADALVRLFDDVETRLDQAFAEQSRRSVPKQPAGESDRRGPDPVEFKSK
jgi:uncharacterized membrane protein